MPNVQSPDHIVKRIVQDIAKQHNTCPKSIMCRSHFKEHVAARRAVILTLWRTRKYSKAGIGRAMGLDHTTVVYHTLRPKDRKIKNVRDSTKKKIQMEAAS